MAKDKIHDQVKHALIKDGWTITHDPYTLKYGTDNSYPDFAAERTMTAQKGEEKILVEVKSFIGISGLHDFEVALGKYTLYLTVLRKRKLDYVLCVALDEKAYKSTFQRPMIQLTVEEHQIPLIIINLNQEEVIKWINYPTIAP